MDFNFDFDIEAFSEFNIELEENFETRYIKPPKTNEIPESLLKYSKAEKLAEDIKLEKKGRYDVILNGSFIFGDFIEAFIVKNAYHVKSMVISTLSLNQNNVDSLQNLIDGGFVEELNLIVSDYFYSHERNGLVKYLYQQLDKDNKFQFAAAGTHCKICLFETYCGLKFYFHGSANLRSSANIEQVCLEENATMFDAHNEYQRVILEKYKTINKSLRGDKLWQTVQTEKAAAVEI